MSITENLEERRSYRRELAGQDEEVHQQQRLIRIKNSKCNQKVQVVYAAGSNYLPLQDWEEESQKRNRDNYQLFLKKLGD